MAAAFLLSACGGTSAPAGTSSAPVSGSPSKPAAASSGSAALQQLYDAAKAEGAVTVWLSWNDELMGPLTKAFSSRFPGVTVERFEINSTQGLERVITEQTAGKVSTDVLQGRSFEMSQVVPRDLAAQYDYAAAFGLPS